MKKFVSILLTAMLALSTPVFADTSHSDMVVEIKTLFNIPNTDNFSLSDTSDSYYNMLWSNDEKDSTRYSVSIGIHNSIYQYAVENYVPDSSAVAPNEKQLEEMAWAQLDKITKNKANYKLKDVSESDYEENGKSFNFQLYIGAYPVVNAFSHVTLSTIDGGLVNYQGPEYFNTEGIVPPKTILSLAQAQEIYMDKIGVQGFFKEYNGTMKMVYLPYGDDSQKNRCIDAESGETFDGNLYTPYAMNAYEKNEHSDGANSFEGDNIVNADDFITAQEAVGILNSKIGTSLKSTDFNNSYCSSDGKAATMTFNSDKGIGFSINDKKQIVRYVDSNSYLDADKVKAIVPAKGKSEEVLKNMGYGAEKFFCQQNENSFTYYEKNQGIPSLASYIDIQFNENGDLVQYNNCISEKIYPTIAPKIDSKRAMTIASDSFGFTPKYVQCLDSEGNISLRLAYAFDFTPVVDSQGMPLDYRGNVILKDSEIYTDVKDSQLRERAMELAKTGKCFETLTSLQPDKTLTLKEFLEFNGFDLEHEDEMVESLTNLNKTAGTSYTIADYDKEITRDEVIKIYVIINLGEVDKLNTAFKNPYTDIPEEDVAVYSVAKATGMTGNTATVQPQSTITRGDLVNMVYSYYKASGR